MDPEIAGKWRQEILEASLEREVQYHLREEQLDCIFKDLEWQAQRHQDQIDKDFKSRLVQCVRKLEDAPDDKKDWHSDSNSQVFDLVQPSAFPFAAGRTRVTNKEVVPPLEFLAAGNVLEIAPISEPSKVDLTFYSKRHQWLPTDIIVTSKDKFGVKSYINNLHVVEHKDMYSALSKRMPEFEPKEGSDYSYEEEKEVEGEKSPKEPTVYVNADDYNLKTHGKPLQVIVKLANIQLTPDTPEHEGGARHIEGMANEDIVATGIYYHTENISESRLNFRIRVREPDHPWSDDRGILHLYGLVNYKDLHQVHSFKLLNPIKPGSHKILAFFPVNLDDPVFLTTFVPPQQRAWDNWAFVAEVRQRLSPELLYKVDQMVDWRMDLEKTKKHREKLMKERRYFSETINTELLELPFSLCEH
ncbi:hypothetical protein BG015_004458 [Linnemannia schmuckeri]|uniref:DUF4246 domain-containing protein n=1 Tax=Linnemannia schmuckeri TaxID=64567 RepID=A0A9P5S4B2_9FUNG|nr:hypothetical protein BG015_004458 [Linnemannia schmuckeri]